MSETIKLLDDIIEENSRIYGLAVISEQFPLSADGLKKVHRRILNVTCAIPRKQLSQGAVSDVRKNHERNDASIYDALIRLSQEFIMNPPLVSIEGGNGHYHDQNASASRYTSVITNQFAKDLLFSHIDPKVLHQTQTEDLTGSEPAFFIPIIPTAILLPVISVGYGEASKLVPRNLQDICKLAIAYCEAKLEGVEFDITKHASKCLPDFPTPTRILNTRQLIDAYKQGRMNEKILMEGVFDISPTKIVVETIPYGAKPLVTQKLQDALTRAKQKKGQTAVDTFIEASIIEPHDRSDRIDIALKPRANPFEVLEVIRRPVDLFGSYAPNPNYVNTEDYIHRPSILDLLDLWYRNRHQALMATKRRQLASLHRRLQQTLAELVAVYHTDKVISIIRGSEINDAIAQLQKEFSLTLWQATYLTKAPIHTLSKTSEKELQDRKVSIEEDIDKLYDTFKEVPSEMISHIADFAHKYAKISKRSPESVESLGYIGTLWFPELKGSIQVSSIDEVLHYHSVFGKAKIEWMPHLGVNKYSLNGSGKMAPVEVVSKIEHRPVLSLPLEKELYTVNIRKDKTACVVKGFAVDKEKGSKAFYTSSRSLLITAKGDVIRGKPKDYLSFRKTISTGAKSDIIYALPYVKGKTYYIAMMSKKSPNTVQVYKIDDTTQHLRFRYDPDMYCMDITPQSARDQSTFFTIPSPKVLSRVAARGVYIKDVVQLLEDESFVLIGLATKAIQKQGVKLIR